MKTLPDITKLVARCAHAECGFQVQAGQKARSELGGAIETYKAVAEAMHDHNVADHVGDCGIDLTNMRTDAGHPATGAMVLEFLPRWWVEKA